MVRSLCLVLLLFFASSSFANQTFIKGGYLTRGADSHKLNGVGVGGCYSIHIGLGPLKPELAANLWSAHEQGYPIGGISYSLARLDDTFAQKSFDTQQIGMLGTVRFTMDAADSVRAPNALFWPVVGIGGGIYQLSRGDTPHNQSGAVVEAFIRVHMNRGRHGDLVIEIAGVRSTDEMPEFAFVQFSLGFELPVRRTVQTH